MDARSIAATAINGGVLTSAADVEIPEVNLDYIFDKTVYENRVYNGFGNPQSQEQLKSGPNIVDWPEMCSLTENLLLEVASVINDPVTTTDELIPSGETSSYRSNPLKLAEFTLSRKDPDYVGRAKAVNAAEKARRELLGGAAGDTSLLKEMYSCLEGEIQTLAENTGIGSVIFVVKPGDGSAREQAASCQRVLGGCGNIAVEYATKRYRSNLINWGMLPFITEDAEKLALQNGDKIYIKGIRAAVISGAESVSAVLYRISGKKDIITLKLPNLSKDDRDIILAGCLMNYYKERM
jgi:aconitate hydratase